MKFERHPLSKAWPDMAREDFDALVLSIEANGLREPITLFEKQVLDGWHRYQACESVGIDGETVDFVGTLEEAAALVSDRHTRRNLTASQRAMAVLKMFEWRTTAGRPQKNLLQHSRLTTKEVAEKAGTSVGTVNKVREALAIAPERAADIKSGKVSASTVVHDANPKKEKPPTTVIVDDERLEALEEQLATLRTDNTALIEDNNAMGAVFEANDQIAAAAKELKMLREQVRINEERIRGLMNEKNQALAQAKMWMNKFHKLEKATKAEAF